MLIADTPLKTPPQNIEAEMAVLGSMLLEEDALAFACEKLQPEFFYKDTHKKIFLAIANLYNKNSPADLVTVSDELKARDELDIIGGPSYITELVNFVPSAANIAYYTQIVKERAILRFLINSSNQIIAEAYDKESNVIELLDRAESLIFEIGTHKKDSSFVPIKEIIKDSIETIDKLYQKKAHVTGVPSGFIDIDHKTAGFQESDLVIIAARPSMGKSALVINIAEFVALNEKVPVAFFSLEMSKEQLVQRLLCSHAKIDAHKVRTGFLSTSDWPKLTLSASRLSEASIFIDDTPAISVMELRTKARRLKSQFDIKLIILDYLQLMRGTSNIDNRQQEISEISRSLKSLARELNVPVIAISQLSRAVESRTDHRPQLSDLRESGAIEQDADVVVLLLREEYYNPTDENQGLAEVIIAKQRNGPVGSINLAFIKEYTRFENLTTKG